MYRLKTIEKALMHLVGWEEPCNTRLYFDENMTESESGLTFQQCHPLMTIAGIASVMPDEWGCQYPAWNVSREYMKGFIVSHNGMLWEAKIANVGNEPFATDFNDDYSADDFGNPYWKPYNRVTSFLEKLTRDGISQMVQTFIQMKQLQSETKLLLDRTTFFESSGRLSNVIMPTKRLVGYEINLTRSSGVTAKVERIGLQFSGNATIRLYLFHTSQREPVKTEEVIYTGNGSYQWFSLKDWYLPYVGEQTNAGGSWYICYDENQLPLGVEAINVSKNWSEEPCGTCNIGSVKKWRKLMQYMQISPFAVNTQASDDHKMWDIDGNVYTDGKCYGLNCEVSVGCDLTDFFIEQRAIFASVLQKQVAVNALRTMAMNPSNRVNRLQSNVNRLDILYELDGNTSGTRPSGLGHELKEAYRALSLDTKGLDPVCLGCHNYGVRIRAI